MMKPEPSPVSASSRAFVHAGASWRRRAQFHCRSPDQKIRGNLHETLTRVKPAAV
jgi:hypothetical protein